MAGAGLIGSAIANGLVQEGHTVQVLSTRPSPSLSSRIGFVHGRIELGADIDALAGKDAVIDATSSHVPATVQRSPAVAISGALGTSAWLAERAVAAGVRCHLYVSSGGTVYGGDPPAEGYRETDAPRPISTYGALKAATETALTAIAQGTGTRMVHLRVANAYGPGQNLTRPQGIIGVAWRNQLDDRETELYASADLVRDFIYAPDLADLCLRAIRAEHVGPLNAGSGRGTSLRELLTLMADVSGRPIDVVQRGDRPFDLPRSVLDIATARSLGWTPATSLRAGLEATWSWISAQERS